MKSQKQSLSDLALKTLDIYQSNAKKFDSDRNKELIEKTWLRWFQSLLPSGGSILDIGCGSGEPIAQYFIQQGFELTGIDFSSHMIALAKRRFPQHTWHLMDMRTLQLQQRFNGIIAWHSFFHLTPEEQRKSLQLFVKHLAPSGVLMVTIGSTEGEVKGHIGDDEVYHASLSCDEYTSLLKALKMKVLKLKLDDPECGGASVLIAQKHHN